MPLALGQRLAHYRIERLIGQGGMGAVYLAQDTRLDRKIALKVLPPEMAASAERLERFQREAQSAAALVHPHIVTTHSIEEAQETHLLTNGADRIHQPRAAGPAGGLNLPPPTNVPPRGTATALKTQGIHPRFVATRRALAMLDFGRDS